MRRRRFARLILAVLLLACLPVFRLDAADYSGRVSLGSASGLNEGQQASVPFSVASPSGSTVLIQGSVTVEGGSLVSISCNGAVNGARFDNLTNGYQALSGTIKIQVTDSARLTVTLSGTMVEADSPGVGGEFSKSASYSVKSKAQQEQEWIAWYRAQQAESSRAASREAEAAAAAASRALEESVAQSLEEESRAAEEASRALEESAAEASRQKEESRAESSRAASLEAEESSRTEEESRAEESRVESRARVLAESWRESMLSELQETAKAEDRNAAAEGSEKNAETEDGGNSLGKWLLLGEGFAAGALLMLLCRRKKTSGKPATVSEKPAEPTAVKAPEKAADQPVLYTPEKKKDTSKAVIKPQYPSKKGSGGSSAKKKKKKH